MTFVMCDQLTFQKDYRLLSVLIKESNEFCHIQGVHKVLIQFQNFFMKSILKIS